MSEWLVASFWVCVYSLCLFSVGATVTLGLQRSRTITTARQLHLVSESLVLGSGFLPWLLLLISMVGVLPTRWIVLGLGGSGLIATWLLRKTDHAAANRIEKRPSPSWILIAPAVLLIIAGIIQLSAASLPAMDVDAVGNWGLKAKVLFHSPLSPQPDYFSDLTLSYSHLDYPLLLPMFWSGMYTLLGRVDDGPAKLALLLPVLAIAALLYAELRPRLGALAWLCVAVTLGAPMMSRWAPMGLADALLAIFILSTAVFLLRWIERANWSDAALAGCCAAFAAQTKLEGLVTLFATGLPLLIWVAIQFRKSWMHGLAFLSCALAIDLPWLIWSRGLPRSMENYTHRLSPGNVIHHLSRLAELFTRICRTLDLNNWGMLVLIVLAAVVLSWRSFKRREVIGLWLMLLILLCGDGLAYLITPWNLADLVPMTLDRLLLQVLPLAMLIVGLHLENLLGEISTASDILPGENAA